MGYWENTTYVRHAAVADVAACLRSLFARERMAEAEAPPRAPGRFGGPMQYDDALHNDLWGVALFSGAPPWTVVKTAPLELLGERREGADRMRLAEACAELSASAIQVNVYDSIGIILVEVSTSGDVLVSGFNERGPDTFAWHSERFGETDFFPRFRVHPFGDLASGDTLQSTEIAQALAARLGGENAAFMDNGVSVDTLVTHGPFQARGGVVQYFRWTGTSRLRSTERLLGRDTPRGGD